MCWLLISACSYVADKIQAVCCGKRDKEHEEGVKGIHDRQCVLSKGFTNDTNNGIVTSEPYQQDTYMYPRKPVKSSGGWG